MGDPIIVEEIAGFAKLSLNRLNAYNAFDLQMITAMADQLVQISKNKAIKGLIITGRGKVFCAGGDLKWASAYHEDPGLSFHKLASQFHQAILEIRRMPKPVVAAINGTAAGGGFSLALACDFRVMAENAIFKQAYTSNGLCIDGGGTFTLPRLVGLAKSLEIIAFDEPISSQKALNMGLVTKVVADELVEEEALNFLRRMDQISPHSFGWCKRLLTDSFNQSFEMQMELERNGLSTCASHADGNEGLRAFQEKRKPNFSN